MNKKWLTAGLAVAMLSTVAAGCSKSEDTAAPSTDGAAKGPDAVQELNLNLGDEIPTLDVSQGTDSISFSIFNSTMEGLVRNDKNGNPQPGIAASWDISPDGLKYTFKLRDAKWQNGDPVTAHDFEYSWKRTLDPNTKSQYAFMVTWVKGGEAYNSGKGSAEEVGVKALDDKTLEVNLESPKAYFLSQMAFPIFFPQNKKFVEAAGNKYGSEADQFVGNGPFKLSEWKHDESATLTKSDSYWDAANVKLNKVNFVMIKDNAAALNLYEAGQLDRTGLVREQIEQYKDSKELISATKPISFYLMYNNRNKALANKNIRKALTYAVDNKGYVDIILNNGSVAASGIVPPGLNDGAGGEYAKSFGDQLKHAENAPKAKEYLEKGLKELGLTALPTLKYLTEDGTTSKKGAEFLKEQWNKNLGINVEIEAVPFKLKLQRSTAGDYDIVGSGWNPDYNDPMTFLDMWITDGDYNETKWSNKEYDAKIQAANKETDLKKRVTLLQDAEKILLDELPIAPNYWSGTKSLQKPYVKNYLTPTIGPSFEIKWTYIEGKN